MIKQVFAWVGRTAHGLISPLLKPYFKRNTRVRVLVCDGGDNVLLVRSWFSHQLWSLPGGGINWGEAPVDAATRELHEETGLQIAKEKMMFLGEFRNAHPTEPFLIKCFAVQAEHTHVKTPTLRKFEVLQVGWFPQTNLPTNCSKTVAQALQMKANKE